MVFFFEGIRSLSWFKVFVNYTRDVKLWLEEVFKWQAYITCYGENFQLHHNSLGKRKIKWCKIALFTYLESPKQWIYVSGGDDFFVEVDYFDIDSIIKKTICRTTRLKTITCIGILFPDSPVWIRPKFFISIPTSTIYKFHALIWKTSIMAGITETLINPLLKEW